MKNENFYNAISPFYDSMISFEKSIGKRKAFYEKVFAKGNITTVADLGCGSGLDSLALAGIGLKVTGFDPSAEMIKLAKKNAGNAKTKINFYRKGILEIPDKFKNQFDCVVSFGNTFANLNKNDLTKAFRKISHLLKPGGLFLFQILNYSRIEKQEETVIGFTDKEDSFIVRFNEFLKDEMIFHFLSVNKKTVSASSHYSTKIYPHKQKFVSALLRQAGFSHAKYYGSLALEKFNPNNSKDLLVLTKK
ncbi:MAG: class I SAM-dependent methyltransferase [Ignavibacteriaceae bacterium]|jgi:ubiquinone/menaquinone biosynthesis C-methylase UbiE|nr:class I SAM-dependent methyltransferase [Ignavibacteriaceae bacterium]